MRTDGQRESQQLKGLNVFSSARREAARLREGLLSHMLYEDIQNRHYSYDWKMSFNSSGGEDHSSSVVHLLREFSRYRARDPDQCAVDYCMSVSVELARYRSCILELYLDPNEDGADAPRLGILPGWSIRKRFGKLQQIQSRDGQTESWQTIPSNQLITVSLPRRETRAFDRATRFLAARDSSPEYAMSERAAAGKLPEYDFASHRRQLDEMTARETRGIGWDGRGLYLDRATTGYKTYRSLIFLRSWLVLVHTSLTALNDITMDPSVFGGATYTVETKGLPTLEDVAQAIDRFADGGIGVDEVHNNLLFRRNSS